MTDEDSPDTHNRRNRLATRRHRLRIVGGVLIVALISGGVASAMALRSRDKTSAATAARHTRGNNNPGPDSSIGTASRIGPPRKISHDDPMRLWIGGDSLAGSFGPALGQTVGATGVVDATIDYKVSSGLEDQGIRDWYEHAQQAMSDIDPDAIVFIIGTNDASITSTYDSNHDGMPDWEVDYRKKVDRMMETFVGGTRHRTVYWLGPPTLGDHNLNKGGYRLGRVMRQEAAKFAPDVVYVDTYHLFADTSGDYSRSLPDGHGEIQEMRISDGVHFSVDGAKYFASDIWRLLNTRWRVTAQSDTSQPIAYTIAEGSNYSVPGVGHYRPTVPSSQSYTTTTGSSSVTSTTLFAGSTSTTITKVTTTSKPVVSTTTAAAIPTTTKPKVTTPTP